MSSEMSHVCHTNNGSSWKVYLQDRFQCLSFLFRRLRLVNNRNLVLGEE